MGEIDYTKLHFVLARLIKFQSLNGCNCVIDNPLSLIYVCNIYAKFQIDCLKTVERRGYITLSFCNSKKNFEAFKGRSFVSSSKWHIHSLNISETFAKKSIYI